VTTDSIAHSIEEGEGKKSGSAVRDAKPSQWRSIGRADNVLSENISKSRDVPNNGVAAYITDTQKIRRTLPHNPSGG
jgi:hypothetical protein